MFSCYNCRRKFKYPLEIITTYEDYVGVSNLFPTKTPIQVLVCPFCESEEFSKENEDEDEE